MHVKLAAEELFSLGTFPITNVLVTTILVSLLLIFIAWKVARKVTLVPGRAQNVSEAIIEPFYSIVDDIARDRKKIIFPIVATFFFFILVSNWLGLLPGFGTIGFFHDANGETLFIPLFRAPTSDLNTTLALALTSLVITHMLAVKYLGIGGYLGKFFSLNPIFLFVGLIELVSEFTKVISLSFRLFGNIFAGETVLSNIAVLSPFLLPLPFLGLEIIVGFVQAAVFMMLTLVFIALLTEKHATVH